MRTANRVLSGRHRVLRVRDVPDPLVNSNSHLPVRDARSISLLNGLNGTEGGGWTSVSTQDILFAMPPEHASPRQMRINRRQHRVRVETGPTWWSASRQDDCVMAQLREPAITLTVMELQLEIQQPCPQIRLRNAAVPRQSLCRRHERVDNQSFQRLGRCSGAVRLVPSVDEVGSVTNVECNPDFP